MPKPLSSAPPSRTYRLKVHPAPEDLDRLVALQSAFARDCAQLHTVAQQHGTRHPLRLHILAYNDLARRPHQALPSQYVTRAIDRVAQQLRAAQARPPARDPFPPQSLDLDARCCAYDDAAGGIRIQSLESKGVDPWTGRAFRLLLPIDFPDPATRTSFAQARFLGGTLIVLTDGRPSILVARLALEAPAPPAPAPGPHTTITQKISVQIRGDVGSISIEAGTRARKEPRPRQPRAKTPAPAAAPPADPTPRNLPPGTSGAPRRPHPTAPGASTPASAPLAPATAPSCHRWLPAGPGAHLCLVTPGPGAAHLLEPDHLNAAVSFGRRRRRGPKHKTAGEVFFLPCSPGRTAKVGLLPPEPGGAR